MTPALLLSLAAQILEVGPGRPFARPEDALRRARPGETILVHPLPGGAPYAKTALSVDTPRLTIRAAPLPDGRRVCLDGEGFEYSGVAPVPRAIVQFNPTAHGGVLEGFELRNARNRTHNGAGVRIAAANDVTIRNCEIHHNDMGVQSNGDAPDTGRNQRLESCSIHHNGSAERFGATHNLYVMGTSIRLTGCEIFAPTVGHNVKSRAHLTWVEACFVHDGENRDFDIVDGGDNTKRPDSHAVLAGNVVAKPPECRGKTSMVHFGQDGGGERQGTLFLVHNTFVQPLGRGIVELSSAGASALIANNLFWAGGSRGGGPSSLVWVRAGALLGRVRGAGNWLSPPFSLGNGTGLAAAENATASSSEVPAFRDPAKGDYRLLPVPGRMVDLGRPLGSLGLPVAPGENAPRTGISQYKPPLQAEPRPFRGPPDAGAYEAGGP